MADGPDFDKIQRNLRSMISQGAPEEDILSYLRGQGFRTVGHWTASNRAGRVVPFFTLPGNSPATASDATVVRNRVQTPKESAAAQDLEAEAARVREIRGYKVADLLRLGAAGVIPGWSDEIVGTLRGMIDSDLTIGEAIDAEREGLAKARTKPFSTLIELGGMVVGTGGVNALAKGSRTLQRITGLGKPLPTTIAEGAGQGAGIGARYGALAASGNQDDESVGQRALSGGTGGLFGVVAGGATGAALSAILRGRPMLDAADVEAVHGAGANTDDVLAASRRVGETVDPATVRPQVMGSDLPREMPLTLADRSRGARAELRAVDRMSGGGAASEAIENSALVSRADPVARASQRQALVEHAIGRPMIDPKQYIEELAASRKTAMDAAYDAAREAAEGLSVPLPPGTRRMLETPAGRKAYAAVRAEDTGGAVTAGVVKPAKAIYASGKQFGDTPPALEYVDASTLSRVAQKLKGMAEEMRPTKLLPKGKSKGVDISTHDRIASIIEDALESTHPAFRDARSLARNWADRVRAAEDAAKLRPNTTPSTVESHFRTHDRAGPTLMDGRSLPNPIDDYRAVAQATRTEALGSSKTATGMMSPNAQQVDDRIFGPGPAAQMREGDRVLREMLNTEATVPSVRGATATSSAERARAQEEMTTTFLHALRDATRFGGNETGAALASTRFIGPALRSLFQPRQSVLNAEARTLLSGGGNPLQEQAALRLLEQARKAADSPIRQGLFGVAVPGATTEPYRWQ